jgi:hypothetical protein
MTTVKMTKKIMQTVRTRVKRRIRRGNVVVTRRGHRRKKNARFV